MKPDLSWSEIRKHVYDRAKGCCEYCRTCEINTGQTMQIDHIDPSGGDILSNLCLACWNCNSHKHTAVTAQDPQTKQDVPLFNPRADTWQEHFRWSDDKTLILGQSQIGRATISRLKMNRPMLIAARKRWVTGGFHPPDE